MPAAIKHMIAFAVIFFVSLVEASPYSKYGRTCKDIGCPSNEICVIAEDPCTSYSSQCGRYPTCKKMGSGEQTCRTMICNSGQICKTDNGRPVCVSAPSGLAPAARKPPGYTRPTGFVPRPTPPHPPPRTSSNRYPVYPGNSIGTGNDSWWKRTFGGGSRRNSDSRVPQNISRGNVYSGGRDNHNTHVSTDSQGNRTWRFSRNRRSLKKNSHRQEH